MKARKSRAAQLESFPDQADLRTVHVRGTQVKVFQQTLDAPREAPAANPGHAACGQKGVLWGACSFFQRTLGGGVSPPRFSEVLTLSLTDIWGWVVFCGGAIRSGVENSVPGLHPLDASDTSRVTTVGSMHIVKCPSGSRVVPG